MVTLRERVIGGALAEKVTWRWIFWLNILFCVIAAIGIPICLRLYIKEGSIRTKLRTFDWFGSFLFVAALTSCLVLVTWRTLVPLILGIFGLIGFIIYSVYISTEPLIRRTLFNSPTAIVAYIGTLVQGLIVWSLLYYMPLYFEVAKNYSPITSAIAIFPFTFTVAPAAVIGWFLTTLGMGLLICLNQSTNIPSWIFLSLVAGIGLGMLFSAQGFAAQASASNADLPFAGAIYSFFRAFGQTLGVAISGVIFQNVLKKKILATTYSTFADEWSRDTSSFVQVVKAWSNIGEEGVIKEVVIKAYIKSLRMVWCIMCVLAGVAFIASMVWTREISLERKLQTEQGFRYNSEKKRPTVDESSLQRLRYR
ncbi:hypothetical protein G7Y89_g9459 [Cudoniella acicularis]|uniref:Uncharacterized protein n=1 Tax=Cudoniella acicularis TaxID=354080 RepID=A0A8H4W2K7_9HELO|nr:hypothetical protein G7Y89_g9459 [Cudoniella acicularis]